MTPAGPPGSDNSRNLILAVVVSMIILFAYEFFIAGPQQRARLAEERAKAQIAQTQKAAAPKPAAPVIVSREAALARTARIPFATDSIDGSINLEGARFDDLSLREYFDAVGSKTEVTLLKPQDVRGAFDAFFGR